MLVFVLLNVHQNKLKDVVKKVKNLDNVNRVHLVYGEYDVIAELDAKKPDVSAKMLKNIRETEGVNSMKTYVVSDQLNDEFKPRLLQEAW